MSVREDHGYMQGWAAMKLHVIELRNLIIISKL